jgi:uncharacterized membrane protein (UPF0127 family)
MITARFLRPGRADKGEAISDSVAHVRKLATRPARRRPGRLRPVAASLAVAALVCACREAGTGSGLSVVVHGERGPTPVRVELALTSDQRAHGLMWRDHLDQDAGMLFVFPEMRDLAFWMKNTPLPLDIIFIDADARVVSIAENATPYSEKSLPSAGPAQYVLEVNAGFSKEHGVRPGAHVELPADLKARSD